jgi:hypothetical protein
VDKKQASSAPLPAPVVIASYDAEQAKEEFSKAQQRQRAATRACATEYLQKEATARRQPRRQEEAARAAKAAKAAEEEAEGEEEEEEEKESEHDRKCRQNMAKTRAVHPNEREILRPFYRLFNSWGYDPLDQTYKPSHFERASHHDGVEFQAFSDPLMRSLSKVGHYETTCAFTDIVSKFEAAAVTARAIQQDSARRRAQARARYKEAEEKDTKYTHYMALLKEFTSQTYNTELTNYDLLEQLAQYNYRLVPNVSYLFGMLVQCAKLLLAASKQQWDVVIELNTEVQHLHNYFMENGVFP